MKRRWIALPLAIAAILSLAAVQSGCWPFKQNDEASQLVHETGDIIATVSPRVDQAEQLLNQALQQQSQNQTDAEKATLNQALQVINDINGQLAQAKANVDKAASLDVSDVYRQYLEAEARSFGYAVDVGNTRLEIANLLVSDPALSQPGSEQKLAQLRQEGIDQSAAAQQAEDEANQIADQHPDEIR